MKKLVIEYRLWHEVIKGGKFPLYKDTVIKVYRREPGGDTSKKPGVGQGANRRLNHGNKKNTDR